MALPTFDATKHDLGIDGKGYMRTPTVPVTRVDAVPATARVASGEGRYDTYQTESFYAQAEWGGGSGQARFVAPDQFLTGIGDGGWGGTFFPARKKIAAASTGGTASWYFERQGTLYGLTASAIEQIGTATTAALTSGTPLCKPVVSASENALWVTSESGTQKIRRWDGTTVSDVTITNVTPYLVSRYGRFIWTFGTRTLSATESVVRSQLYEDSSGAKTAHKITFSAAPRPENTLVVFVYWNTAAALTLPSDWALVDTVDNANTKVACYYKTATTTDTSVTATLATAADCTIIYAELAGTLTATPLDSSVSSTGTATNPVSGSLTPTSARALLLAGFNKNQIGSATYTSYSNSFTALQETASAATDHNAALASRVVTSSAAYSTTATTSAGSVAYATLLVAFQGNQITADLTQTAIHYTSDDGSTWLEAFQGDSAGIPVPKTAVAAQGYLWLATRRGLYQLAADEHEFEDHQVKVIVGITGPHDEWAVPFDTASVGTWLATFDGLIYYNVGATLRQFAPGGSARQVWPSPDWSTVSGEVQSVVGGEGGVYFGAAGYLWRYNGKGVMPLAAEPAADDFDFLQWYQGKLYFNDDPASYFDFKYPSSRPDVSAIAATNFTTGYMISSVLDFEKTSETKIIRQFEAQGFFTGGTTEATGGSILVEYAVGDGLLDPGKYGGGASSITWTNVGKLLVTDNGIKRFSLPTPLTCKRLYVRVTLTPGSTGYPVLTALIVNGRSIMPSVKRFTTTLNLSTGLVDRKQNVMYETADDVNAAIDALETLRATGTYFTLSYPDDDGTATDYVVTFDQKQDVVNGFRGAAGMSAAISVNFLELP